MILVLVDALVCGGCGAFLINSLTTVYVVSASQTTCPGSAVGATDERWNR